MPRFFNNSTLSKRLSTLRFVWIVLAPLRLRCCDMKLPRLERANYHRSDQLQIFGRDALLRASADVCMRPERAGSVSDAAEMFADAQERVPTDQISPSFIFPASLIMCWFQGGSQTNSTDASSTPEIDRILSLASWAMACPNPNLRTVKDIFLFTRDSCSGVFLACESYNNPDSQVLFGICAP